LERERLDLDWLELDQLELEQLEHAKRRYHRSHCPTHPWDLNRPAGSARGVWGGSPFYLLNRLLVSCPQLRPEEYRAELLRVDYAKVTSALILRSTKPPLVEKQAGFNIAPDVHFDVHIPDPILAKN
jgi:hypothetical protein